MRRNSKLNPIWPIVIGTVAFAVGIVLLGYTYFEYKDWDEVQASYIESDCRIKTESIQHRGTKPRKVMYCDRIISYTYKGVPYSHTENEVRQASDKPEVRLVDPKHPEESIETKSNYMIAVAFIVMGLLFGGCGVYMRKNR